MGFLKLIAPVTLLVGLAGAGVYGYSVKSQESAVLEEQRARVDAISKLAVAKGPSKVLSVDELPECRSCKPFSAMTSVAKDTQATEACGGCAGSDTCTESEVAKSE